MKKKPAELLFLAAPGLWNSAESKLFFQSLTKYLETERDDSEIYFIDSTELESMISKGVTGNISSLVPHFNLEPRKQVICLDWIAALACHFPRKVLWLFNDPYQGLQDYLAETQQALPETQKARLLSAVWFSLARHKRFAAASLALKERLSAHHPSWIDVIDVPTLRYGEHRREISDDTAAIIAHDAVDLGALRDAFGIAKACGVFRAVSLVVHPNLVANVRSSLPPDVILVSSVEKSALTAAARAAVHIHVGPTAMQPVFSIADSWLLGRLALEYAPAGMGRLRGIEHGRNGFVARAPDKLAMHIGELFSTPEQHENLLSSAVRMQIEAGTNWNSAVEKVIA